MKAKRIIDLIVPCVVGLQITLEEDHKIEYSYVKVKKSKVSLEIMSSALYDKINPLKKDLYFKDPVYIGIDGKGILSKIISSENKEEPLQMLLPNVTKQDFYCQVHPLGDDRLLISAARKDIIDPIIDLLRSHEILPVEVSLGISSSICCFSLLNLTEDIQLPYYRLAFQANRLEGILKTSKQVQTLQIGKEDLENRYLLPLGLTMSDSNNYSNITREALGPKRMDHRYKRGIIISSFAALVSFIAVVLVNFIINQGLVKNESELSNLINAQQNTLMKINTLREEILKKETVLSQIEPNIMHYSYYADRIASTIGKGIRLKTLIIAPEVSTAKAIKKKERIYLENTVYISGVCNDSQSFNSWVQLLNGKSWIKQLEIKQFSIEDITGSPEFELNIELKEID